MTVWLLLAAAAAAAALALLWPAARWPLLAAGWLCLLAALAAEFRGRGV